MHKKTLIVLVSLALLLCVFTAPDPRAERATPEKMELVCQNWLSYMVYQRGAWAGETRPQIVGTDEVLEGDTVLGRCFSIVPRGFVVVPILKELPPIQAYSEEYGLDVNQTVGFPQLLREFLLDRIRLYAKIYGSLDAVQPPTGDVLLGRGHKMEWSRFLKNQQEFETDLREGKFKPLTEVGPLLTTSWHQRAPYNNLCPRGDTTCIICPSGKLPTIPTVVGCVATATAQILRYWNYPPSGTGTHSYTWYGDYSCNGSTPSQNLFADYSDPYDWQNMPDSCDSGCAPQDSAALAELCYEVGVAFEMSYGVCGSGAYTADALTVFPTYFRYDPSIDIEYRADYTAAEWFSIIQDEINNGRPMQYRIRSHSIVCDGWRDTGGQNQYHMNYGWGGSFTTWFAIDSLYCYWVLPDNLCPPEEEFLIRNIMPLPPDSIPFAPAANYSAGEYPRSIFCADLDGDGDLDLAVANLGSTNVSILKNNGDGTFQPKVDYAAGSGPHSVFCADLDGDGYLDLAVANGSSVSILKNNGDGTFQPKVDYPAGDGPYSVFCADLDGDDDLDLAVANYIYGIGTVSLLKNNGNGTFQLDSSYIAGDSPRSVFCADLDGDLDLDLAVANEWSYDVSILKNNGNGTFQPKVDYAASGCPASVFCADLDGDSDLDLAVGGFGSKVSILKNNGDGTFQPSVDYGSGLSPLSVFCADLDGDSDLDLAMANSGFVKASYNTVSILRDKGNGTFQTKVDYGVGTAPVSVFCADLDGDGDLDLAVTNDGSNNVSILKNLTQVPANQPPNPFSLLSPTDGSRVLSVVTLDWQVPYDPNFGDQIRYDLYVSTVPSFDPDSTSLFDSLPISRLTDTLDIDTYYWKVKAYDNWGAERWSTQTWNFQVVLRGDVNGDGAINVTDVVYLINYKFLVPPGPAPQPWAAGDVNCDGTINVTDVVYLINFLFLVPPGPPPGC
jgi:hypothetical protein